MSELTGMKAISETKEVLGLVDRLRNLLCGQGESREEDLVGLERKPRERASGLPGSHPVFREDILLTARRDLLSIRQAVLARASRTRLLREIDYTIDQLDNVLAEM